MMTVTNSTPIMSTKAETGDQNRAPGGVGGDQPRTLGPVDQTRNIGPGDQTRTPTLKDLPHTILAAKPCPIALPTQPTLGPHRPLIEEIRPNPIESPAVGKYILMLCPFTGPKMFCAGPNVLSQPKNLFTYYSQKDDLQSVKLAFVPAQKPLKRH